MVKVELLCIRDCPNGHAYLSELQALVWSAGFEDRVLLRVIESADQAAAERFLGSPTVRVDGIDVDPTAAGRGDYAIGCRLYRSPTGATGRPPADWVRQAFGRAAERTGPPPP